MPDLTTLLVFSGAALVLFVVPGPAVLYILARSVGQGRTAGLVSVAGIHLGSLVHIAAAVAGLSAVVTSSAFAFTTVRLAGAAYLIYIGIRTIREGGPGVSTVPRVESRSLSRVFRDGFIVNLLNPKTAVFFLAFVPQFVNPDAGSATTQLLMLGGLFVVLGSLSDGAYALAGGSFGRWVHRRPEIGRRQHLVTGTTYIGLGVAAALSGGAE